VIPNGLGYPSPVTASSLLRGVTRPTCQAAACAVEGESLVARSEAPVVYCRGLTIPVSHPRVCSSCASTAGATAVFFLDRTSPPLAGRRCVLCWIVGPSAFFAPLPTQAREDRRVIRCVDRPCAVFPGDSSKPEFSREPMATGPLRGSAISGEPTAHRLAHGEHRALHLLFVSTIIIPYEKRMYSPQRDWTVPPTL